MNQTNEIDHLSKKLARAERRLLVAFAFWRAARDAVHSARRAAEKDRKATARALAQGFDAFAGFDAAYDAADAHADALLQRFAKEGGNA